MKNNQHERTQIQRFGVLRCQDKKPKRSAVPKTFRRNIRGGETGPVPADVRVAAAPQVTAISALFTLSPGTIDHETELRPGEKEIKAG